MVTIKILKDLIEEMDYSGGINWNKMIPPEDERYKSKWIPLEEYEELQLNSETSHNNDFKKVCPKCGSPTLSQISENVIGCENPKCTYIGKPIIKS